MLHFPRFFAFFAILFYISLEAREKPLPEKMLQIMQQDKYQHANWGIYARDSETGQVFFDLNSHQLFLPGSTTKLFTVAALLHAYGDNYRFKTPLFALGKIEEGVLKGDLVLVGQGDLTMGGRQAPSSDTISFTRFDHIYANLLPKAILTPENPLRGIQEIAKQVREKGIKQINGEIRIDDRLFETVEKREMVISPIIINDNLIDIVLNPTQKGETASLFWRPQVPGYSVKNEVKTVENGKQANIELTSDESGRNMIVRGTISLDQKNVVRVSPIKDPKHFAKAALMQALEEEGIKITEEKKENSLPPQRTFANLEPIALWVSPPLSQYAKLILKVSHNLGADLIPLLLGVQKGSKTFDEGMIELGKFVVQDVKVAPTRFVFMDGAGGDGNRLTPRAEIQLLEYVRNLPRKEFQNYYDSLPILGVDGSLADFGKETPAVGKARAKTGTGVSFNFATHDFFLTTQAFSGYIEGQNGHLIEFMVVVNNGTMPEIQDIFPIFEDLAQITSLIYENAK